MEVLVASTLKSEAYVGGAGESDLGQGSCPQESSPITFDDFSPAIESPFSKGILTTQAVQESLLSSLHRLKTLAIHHKYEIPDVLSELFTLPHSHKSAERVKELSHIPAYARQQYQNHLVIERVIPLVELACSKIVSHEDLLARQQSCIAELGRGLKQKLGEYKTAHEYLIRYESAHKEGDPLAEDKKKLQEEIVSKKDRHRVELAEDIADARTEHALTLSRGPQCAQDAVQEVHDILLAFHRAVERYVPSTDTTKDLGESLEEHNKELERERCRQERKAGYPEFFLGKRNQHDQFARRFYVEKPLKIFNRILEYGNEYPYLNFEKVVDETLYTCKKLDGIIALRNHALNLLVRTGFTRAGYNLQGLVRDDVLKSFTPEHVAENKKVIAELIMGLLDMSANGTFHGEPLSEVHRVNLYLHSAQLGIIHDHLLELSPYLKRWIPGLGIAGRRYLAVHVPQLYNEAHQHHHD